MESERQKLPSVAPPGFAAVAAPVAAVAPAGAVAPALQPVRLQRSAPDVPWRGLLVALLVVAVAAAAYLVLRPRPPSAEAGARATVNAWDVAFYDGNPAEACSLMSPRAQIAAAVTGATKTGAATCIAGMRSQSRSLLALPGANGPGALDRVRDAQIAETVITVSPDHRQALATFGRHKLLLVRANGSWLLDARTPASGVPALVTGGAATFADRADAACRAPLGRAGEMLVPLLLPATGHGAWPSASAIAARLGAVDAIFTPWLAQMRALVPPATEAAAYNTYLAGDEHLVVGLRTIRALAAHGKRYTPFLLLSRMAKHPDPGVDRAANALGFKLCD